jgi:hypothetical protein
MYLNVIKKYLLHELKLKVLALALALILWFSMTYMGESKMGFLVPLSFYNVSTGMVMRETDTKNVVVTVNGPLSVLKNMKAEDIRVPLNLSRLREGRHIFNIGKGDVIVPPGVKVEDAKPDYVVVELDKIVEKHLRVVVRLDMKWRGIYEVASWYPTYVDAEGPKELLEKKAFLETVPVDGNFKRPQEILDIPLDAKSLEARKVVPDTARVVLRRIGR